MNLLGLLMLGIVALSGLRTGNSDNNSVALNPIGNQAIVPPAVHYDLEVCRTQIGIPASVKNAWFNAARTDNRALIFELEKDFPQILNIQDELGNTAIMLATTWKNCEASAALLYLGANTSIPNKSFQSAVNGQGEGIRNDVGRIGVNNVGTERIKEFLKARNVCPQVAK